MEETFQVGHKDITPSNTFSLKEHNSIYGIIFHFIKATFEWFESMRKQETLFL